MWPDNETDRDFLGFGVHAQLIRSVVLDSALHPVTVGIFADWGGGKSSLMKMIARDLDPKSWPKDSDEAKRRSAIACLYFNGWLFEGYDDAKSALLTSILVALAEHRRFGPKLRDKAISLLKSVNWMRVVRLGLKHATPHVLSALAGGGVAFVPGFGATAAEGKAVPEGGAPDKAGDANQVKIDWEGLIRKDTSTPSPLDVREFRNQFRKMLDDSDVELLVVLIDDLDRCAPDRIIENLEAIKLFLNVESTAFVIAADPRIVRDAIRHRYSQYAQQADTDEANESLVTDYLEKLIQVPYTLPRLSPLEIETYMVLLLCEHHLAGENLGKCTEAWEAVAAERHKAFGYGHIKDAIHEVPTELAKDLAFCSTSAPLLAEGLKGNPRQVKRFLNALFLRRKLISVARLEAVELEILVKLMILEYTQPRCFLQLFEWQATQNGQPAEIRDLERSLRPPDGSLDADTDVTQTHVEWSKAIVRRWVAMDPPLADTDLRDYFWLARDRLRTRLSGLSIVAPVVRRALEGVLSPVAGKRAAAIETAKSLDEDERITLLELLEQHITRHLGEKDGFDGLRALIEAEVAGADDILCRILAEQPLETVPPAVGMDTAMLAKKVPKLEPALARLRDSDTKVGRAVKGESRLKMKSKKKKR